MMESPDYIKPRSAKLDKLERNMGRKVLVLHSALLSDILLLKIARLLGKNNERFILENVQNILAARIETQEPQ